MIYFTMYASMFSKSLDTLINAIISSGLVAEQIKIEPFSIIS